MGITSSSSASVKKLVNMEGETAQFVQEKINNHKIMIFSKSYCPYCKTAKECFNELGAKYEVLELDKDPKGNEIQDILLEITGARSVPRVFVNGKCIGGGSETKELLNSGQLKKMIEEGSASG
ncbi:Glutaredoxin-C4 [Armadillidium vulgare]|nr:Glutaredoxin-C4 [Armadillidium vulgare]